jgi:hypothetical protein
MVKDFNGVTDFAECFIRLEYKSGPGAPSLIAADWFSPFRDLNRMTWTAKQVAPFPTGYDYKDQDLSSAGPILPPGLNLLLGAGKDGVLYVLDPNNLGKTIGDLTKLKCPPSFFTFDPDRSIPAFANAKPDGNLDFKPMKGVKTYHLHASPVYWKSDANGPQLFVWGENTTLRTYSLGATGKTTLLARGSDVASGQLASPNSNTLGGMPGGMLCLSANGGKDGVLWATAPIDLDANKAAVPGVVRAYDAASFAAPSTPGGVPQMKKLWEAKGFTYSKFCPPMVADGKVFVATYDGTVDVYVVSAPPSP